jgi:multisubunit Na+/H+ antiporter MnhB subunit
MARPEKVTARCCFVGTLAVLSVALAGVLLVVVWLLPESPQRLAARFQDPVSRGRLVARSGVGNPVTAVLLNFRAYDTLLELAVLTAALLGAQAVHAGWSRQHAKSRRVPNPLLAASVGVVVPTSIVVAGYLLWTGAALPGGAFQAGAVLGGAGVMLLVAHRLHLPVAGDWRYRLATVVGIVVFLSVGVGVMPGGWQFLQYPPALAKWLILAIETAATASVASVLVLLFNAVTGPIDWDAPAASAGIRGDR